MRNKVLAGAAAVVLIGFAIMVRELFPKKILSPVRIALQVDTVATIDTLWRTKLQRTTDTLWLTRVEIQKPETVYRVPPLVGLTGLSVASVGDTSRALGFRLTPIDTGYTIGSWSAQWYTPGPLKALVVPAAGFPQAEFGPAPRECGFGCVLKHYLTGAAVGGGATAIACAVGR